MGYSECLPTRLKPLTEGTCFSQVRSARSGTVYWDPDPPAQLTTIFGEYVVGAPSAAANSIYAVDAFAVHRREKQIANL